MEANEKEKEIEAVVIELQKLGKYLCLPIERFRKLRNEIDASIDFLRGLQKSIKRAKKKDLGLMVEIAAGMETSELNILDRFFEQVVAGLDKTQREVKEWRAAIGEPRKAEQTSDMQP